MPRVNYELPSEPKRSASKTRISPMGTKARDTQREAMIRAQKALIAERQAYMDSHNGNYPSDEELEASRKKR